MQPGITGIKQCKTFITERLVDDEILKHRINQMYRKIRQKYHTKHLIGYAKRLGIFELF